MVSVGKVFVRGAVLAVAFCVPQVVTAALVTPSFGTYQMGDAFPTHGLWFSDELVATDGNGLNGSAQMWAGESATLTYTDLGGAGLNTLEIDGVVTNNGYRLGFDFDLVEISHAGDPACGRPDCQLSGDATQDLYDGVRNFDFPVDPVSTSPASTSPSATIFGLDGVENLTGLLFALSINPPNGTKPPQFGFCGNWVDCQLGYSNWFNFLRTDSSDFGQLGIDDDGNGDLNLTVVPVPAAVWLFGTALIGLVGFSKRRKSA